MIEIFLIQKKKNSLNILTIDSYTKKNLELNKNNIFDKVVLLSDKKPLITNPDIIIDHTYNRKKKFYFNEEKKKIDCYVGINFFPFEKIRKTSSKKKIILINFGTTYDIDLINKSLRIIKKLNFNKEIMIISNYFDMKLIKKDYFDLKIQVIKSTSYLPDIYKKTFLSFGSCGISLYEKLPYRIPSICTPVAGNQMNNYRNFSKSKLIIKMNDVFKIDNQKVAKELKSLKKHMNNFIKTIDKKKIIDIINLYEKKN